MVTVSTKLVLWTGPRHSGKTTTASDLVKTARKKGFIIAGLLAPSLYNDGKLIGFDALDLRNNTRKPLARFNTEKAETRLLKFIPEGLKVGYTALSQASTQSADLVIVDEFGPLELEGQVWREAVDLLLSNSNSLILLVVRQELSEKVHLLYAEKPFLELAANDPESIDKVINILRNQQ
jgi:nucleoside-triphosphatase THEP1